MRFLLALTAIGCLVSALYADEINTATTVSTTRESIALTIYDQNFAMVTENRPLSLRSGMNEIVLQAVSPLIDPSSVLFRWDARSALRAEILAHSYDMGVQGTDALLRRYIGRNVLVRRYDSAGRLAGDLQGVLLSADEKGIVVAHWETRDPAPTGGLHVNPHGELILPVAGDDPTLPALRVQIRAPQAGEARLTTSYLTGGLDWDADYAIVLQGDRRMQLQLWATVTNQTGLSFPEARLTLVSGALTPEPLQAGYMADLEFGGRGIRRGMRMALGGTPQPLGELYSYPVARVVSLSDSRQSRVMLHEASSVPVRKRYLYRAPLLSPHGSPLVGKEARRSQTEVALVLENRKEHGLGLPLPRGSVRIYEAGANGALQYIGAGNMPATPNGERAEIGFGRAFDVTGEWLPLKQNARAKGITVYEVQITLRNAKSQPVEVQVVQPFNGAWRMLQSSHSHTRLSATAAQWTVKVPANGSAQVRFTVEVRAL